LGDIVLAGSVSGTTTLTPTAVSGTTTLTLPATTGTVALTASPTFTGQATIPTINLTGGQIVFPATQSASSDANTLDDYEEGNVTLQATSTLSAATGTITINTGTSFLKYVKIGRQVTVTGVLVVTSVSSPTGNLSFLGFPFVSGSNCNTPITFYAYSWAATMTTVPVGTLGAGVADATIQKLNSTGSVAVIAPDVAAGTTIFLSIIYYTT